MELDAEQLARLRDALLAIRTNKGEAVPRASLAQLAEALPAGLGMTVDFDAEAVLGQPMVVLRPTDADHRCFETLSPRENEVAGLVATGLRNKDVAIALEISIATVKDHVHNILRKTGLDSRSAVAAEWNRRR